MKEIVPGESCGEKTILVLKGNAKYSVTRFFADELIEGFRELGYRCEVFDARSQMSTELREMAKRMYAFVLAVNGTFTSKDIEVETIELLKKNCGQFVAYMVDHPCHHRDRLSLFDRNILVTFPDRKHVEYVKQFYPQLTMVEFLPHAGMAAGKGLGKAFAERTHNLVFAGSYYDVMRYEKTIEGMEAHTKNFVRACIQCLEQRPELTVEQAMSVVLYGEEALKQTVLPINFSEKSNSDLLLFLDEYIRTKVRAQVVSQVAASGQDIEVYGSGWESFTCNHMEHVHVRGEVDFGTLQKILDDTKIFLNIMPWFKDGSHERVFTAIEHGAVVLNDESTYLMEMLPDREMVFYYSLSSLEKIEEILTAMLQKEDMEQVRLAAQELVSRKHLWCNRSEWILKQYRRYGR